MAHHDLVPCDECDAPLPYPGGLCDGCRYGEPCCSRCEDPLDTSNGELCSECLCERADMLRDREKYRATGRGDL